MEAGAADRAVVGPKPGPSDGATDRGGDPTPVLPDAAPSDAGTLFAGCPGPEAYVGNPAWRDALVIKPGLRRCARFVESDGTLDRTSTANSLEASLARKMVATIAPGTYKLPDTQGKASFGIPVCLVPRTLNSVATRTGTIDRGMYGTGHTFQISLPVPAMGLVRVDLFWQGASPFSVDGVDYLQHCPDEVCAPGVGYGLEECTLPANPFKDVVTLENGSVELAVIIYRAGIGAGTEPGVFSGASGTFGGVTFDQRDYFKLVYSPEHHHFTRNYAVFFDAPIAGACGLELVNLPGPPSTRPVHAYTVDCQLTRKAELKVLAVTRQ